MVICRQEGFNMAFPLFEVVGIAFSVIAIIFTIYLVVGFGSGIWKVMHNNKSQDDEEDVEK